MFNAGGGRQGILNLQIKDKASLYQAYMPFVKGGGIFVPTTKKYAIGDDVFLFLLIPAGVDREEKVPVAGRVVWITPTGAQGSRQAGIGVQFPDGAEGEAVRTKIESMLAGILGADKPTQTM